MDYNNTNNSQINQENQESFSYSPELKQFIESIKSKVTDEQMLLEALFLMTKTERLIFNSYQYIAANYDKCYVSIDKIALNSGCERKSVKRFLKKYKNIFWYQEERQSQTNLIHVDEWVKASYKCLIGIIKNIGYLKDRKKYLINNVYNKGLSLKDLYQQKLSYKQLMNKKRTKMPPPISENVPQYSSSYSVLEELRSLDSETTFDKVLIKMDWKGFNINLQQKKYLSTNYSLNSIENAQKELRKQLRMEKPVKSEFGLLYHLANNFNKQGMRA